MKKLLLIDASGFIFRAYHALPPLSNPQGVPVGAVFGFLNIMFKTLESSNAEYIACVFDVSRITFRNRMYAEYKAHRPPPPDDLIPQFALVRDAARALNVAVVESPDFEADDVIATYATQATQQGIEVTIISSDKDLMQLIGPGVGMYDAMKQKPIGEAEVMEKFGVEPARVCDVLALIGDSSDNVPGVPGIGPKTAAELIQQYGDLETLLSRASEIKQPKRRETLLANIENARLSKALVCLKHDAPVPCPIEALKVTPPVAADLQAFLQLHGFHSLQTKLAKLTSATGTSSAPRPASESAPAAPVPAAASASTPTAPAPAAPRNYSLVSTAAELAAWITRAQRKGRVAFDTETDQLDPMLANLVGFSLCVEAGEACYVPLQHIARGTHIAPAGDLFSSPEAIPLLPNQLPLKEAVALLKPLLEDESVLKIGHNIKYDLLIMKRHGADINTMDDTMLISYCLSAGLHGHGMDELAEKHLGLQTISFNDVTGTGKARVSFAEVELEKARDYAAEDADVTLQLWERLKPELQPKHLLTLYETIERPLIGVLAAMEYAGIKVDLGMLASLSSQFAITMQQLEQEIHALAGQSFNIGSPKQLGEIFFDVMGLDGGRKSAKTGAYSTDNEVLESLSEQGHTIAEKVIEWRQLAKLKNTYTDALKEQIHPQTHRVHTNFSMAIASTGRLSSTDPNLQNIPIRSELGKKIRTAFVAEKGNKLISADYSQIELRLLAHMADIPTLKAAFQNGEDIHTATASAMFGVAPAQVNGDLRRQAKTINFGIIYGISAHGLAMRLGISRGEAASFIEAYFAQYPGIRDYMERTKEFARAHGYVETLFGRRCHVPGIHDKNGGVRQFSERAAINAPLQGTAADIIKRAMIHLKTSSDLRLLLQVHDELVFEVPENQVEIAKPIIKKAMEQAANISVPLTVEIGAGNHWGEIH